MKTRRSLLAAAALAAPAQQFAQQPTAQPSKPSFTIRPASVPFSEQKLAQSIPIPKQSGRGVVLMRDQRLKVITPRGKQIGDLFAFVQNSNDEFIAPAYTITRNRNIYLKTGRPMFSNYGTPLLIMEEDTVGRHDLLYPACSGSQRPGVPAKIPNCRDNMQAALRAINFPVPEHPEIVHPHNLFQNTPIANLEGQMEFLEPLAKPGDYVVIRALENVVVVVTACSSPSIVNGNDPKELLMEVYA